MPPLVLVLVLAFVFVAMWFAVSRTLGRTPYEATSFVAGLFFVGTLLAAIAWFSVIAGRGDDAQTGAGLINSMLGVSSR